ncbi:MAG TPA: DUF6036 family nucleotidyltransferase [Chthoniobacterales bacterium]
MPIEITAEHLELAVRRMAELTGEMRFILVGRGTLAVTAPPHLRNLSRSDDIDIWPRDREDAALDESIERFGEDSEFYHRHGFYIERVGNWTLLTQPDGWQARATEVRFGELSLLVLGLLDLAYNKLEAYREKDRQFLIEGFRAGLFQPADVKSFIEEFAPTADARSALLANLAQISGE